MFVLCVCACLCVHTCVPVCPPVFVCVWTMWWQKCPEVRERTAPIGIRVGGAYVLLRECWCQAPSLGPLQEQ